MKKLLNNILVIILISGCYCSCKNKSINEGFKPSIFDMLKIGLTNPEFNKAISYFLNSSSNITVYNSNKLDTNLTVDNRTYFIINKAERAYYNESFKKPFIRVEYKSKTANEGELYLYFYPLKGDGIIGVTYFKLDNNNLKVKKSALGHVEMAIPMEKGDSIISSH